MHRRILFAAVLAAVAVAVPSTAQASTLERHDGLSKTLLLTGGADETNLVTVEGSKAVVIRDDGAPLNLSRTRDCQRIDTRAVRCSSVRRIILDLREGPDVAAIATGHEVWLDGGTGDDRYLALGTDAPSRVDFSGGFGTDVANYGFATEGVVVGVDGFPFDGRPGDNDRIGRTVETVLGSAYGDLLAGGERDQRLAGGDGDDTLVGGPGQDVLEGGPGNDRIGARDGELDTIDCGGDLLDRVAADAAETSILGCAEVLMAR
jgi:Ca2+-binding RTX toxin-like protein